MPAAEQYKLPAIVSMMVDWIKAGREAKNTINKKVYSVHDISNVDMECVLPLISVFLAGSMWSENSII